jgi:nucleoside-diphosphate-sugar epimerase
VTATTTSAAKLDLLARLGADGAVMDGLDAVSVGEAVGSLYGPGAIDDQVKLVRKRMFPLVGGGTGYFSWVHLDDAASATVLAMEQQAKGVFNIVDDEPAPASEWLPYLAECAGASSPTWARWQTPAGRTRLASPRIDR